MKNGQATFTPKGLTQNWTGLQQQGGTKKVKRSGPFVSRREEYSQRHIKTITPNTVVVREVVPVEHDPYTAKTQADGTVKVSTRKNGKFAPAQIYSKSLAEKLGL